MLVFPKHFNQHKHHIGPKALNLKKLADLHLEVPRFAVVPAPVVVELWQEYERGGQARLRELAREITQDFGPAGVAVRSNALIEDDQEYSHAGQFLTKLNVQASGLPEAVVEVMINAHKKLGGKLELFSLLVQEYVAADYSGVTFTRNPFAGREMVFEFNRGRGERVVGGQTHPERLEVLWTASPPDRLSGLAGAVEQCKDIERFFGHPQDIEWCIKNGTWYFLQSRPITTMTLARYRECIYLDKVLASSAKYYYEKTEISEIAPRPTPFTLSLLELIYRKDGPIDRVYRRYGIAYRSSDVLKIFGNELYIDREKEIKTLFPAYSYFTGATLAPRLAGFEGLLTTLKNFYRINALPQKYKPFYEVIRKKLGVVPGGKSLEETVKSFLKDYELIFAINLLAEKAVRRLQQALRNDKNKLSLLLNVRLDENVEELIVADSILQGNSLEVSDLTPFSSRLSTERARNDIEALARMGTIKRLKIEPLLKSAQMFNRLREYGRWLTVKHVNAMRQVLLGLATQKNFNEPQNIYFLTVPELEHGKITEDICRHRKLAYQEYDQFNLPPVLTHAKKPLSRVQPFGVSPGEARGRLVDVEDLASQQGSAILYTKMLSPDLVQYFPKVRGIVSERGGVLSHLAIMARENHIPVVVNVSLEQLSLRLGQEVVIDGSTGTVRPMR